MIITFLLDDIMEFHRELENKSVISSGIRDISLLESAINAPFQTFGGSELYPTVEEKAAHLFYGLVKNHGFVDGNKRVAVHTMFISKFEYCNGSGLILVIVCVFLVKRFAFQFMILLSIF